MTRRRKKHQGNGPHNAEMIELASDDARIKPDWTKKCQVCDASPIVPLTGLCGPCTFGEADTVGGNW